MSSCLSDDEGPADSTTPQDQQLMDALRAAAPTQRIDYFALPDADDYARIPQDPNNPLTTEKVALGRLLYHETGLATHAKRPEGMLTYSCASCHHAQAGFQAGVRQGISDGGLGFGHAGEGRHRNPSYPLDAIDVQPLRTPATLNIAYQKNVLWNGQFGATGSEPGHGKSLDRGYPTSNKSFRI